MIPPTVPPFPFYIINKDIIKGSFPFRKTFLTPKLDFEARFRNPIQTAPRVPPTRRAGTEPRKRNELAAKPDFATRFRPPRVFRRPEEPQQNHGNGTNLQRSPISQPDSDRPACSADPKSRNRTTETEQIGSERKFSSPENTSIRRIFYLCSRRLRNQISDIAVRSVRKSAFKPLPAPLLPGKPAGRKA